jgi:hypothetical protein
MIETLFILGFLIAVAFLSEPVGTRAASWWLSTRKPVNPKPDQGNNGRNN